MSNIVKIISTELKKSRLFVKFFRYGKSDVQEVPQALPFGIDSNPIKDLQGLYIKTAQKGDAVLVGYVQKSVADVGELRLFSTNSNGVEQTYTLFKNNGDIELNGNTDNMVRYSSLNTGLANYASNVGVELGKIAAVLNGIVPGSYVPVVPSVNISAAKINNIKTN